MFSNTELLPLDWLPTTTIWGRSMGLLTPTVEKTSCSLLTSLESVQLAFAPKVHRQWWCSLNKGGIGDTTRRGERAAHVVDLSRSSLRRNLRRRTQEMLELSPLVRSELLASRVEEGGGKVTVRHRLLFCCLLTDNGLKERGVRTAKL